MFVKGKCYTRDEIHAELGGSVQTYLPTVDGRVVAACFKRSPTMNPDAPDIILAGVGSIIQKTADQFTTQGNAVPTFMKKDVNRWEYAGDYRVQRQSYDKDEIDRFAAKANRRGDVSSVLFLEHT